MTTAPAIELKGISKSFGPVQANKDISIRVMPGTIHGIIGGQVDVNVDSLRVL
jgi:simple sugar transport system ATP-binding protein